MAQTHEITDARTALLDQGYDDDVATDACAFAAGGNWRDLVELYAGDRAMLKRWAGAPEPDTACRATLLLDLGGVPRDLLIEAWNWEADAAATLEDEPRLANACDAIVELRDSEEERP